MLMKCFGDLPKKDEDSLPGSRLHHTYNPALTTHPAWDQARDLAELLITRGDQSQLNTGATLSQHS